jgi:uncharacterized protein YrrD
MHLRSSAAIGTFVVDDSTQQPVGVLGEPVIDPDTGRILGFFVFSARVGMGELFLQSMDIISWGTRVHIKNDDCLGPPDDFVRLQRMFDDPRTFLGQQIRTEKMQRVLGRCVDVQFNTHHFQVEWLFPRRFFMNRQPIPATDIVEVTPEAIIVREPIRATKEVVPQPEQAPSMGEILPTLQRE